VDRLCAYPAPIARPIALAFAYCPARKLNGMESYCLRRQTFVTIHVIDDSIAMFAAIGWKVRGGFGVVFIC